MRERGVQVPGRLKLNGPDLPGVGQVAGEATPRRLSTPSGKIPCLEPTVREHVGESDVHGRRTADPYGWRIPGGVLGTGSVGLGIVAAAYMAETIRAGVEAVPLGQSEAARSLGMSSPIAMTFIILPQAFRIIIPPLTNELVLLLKDTSLLFVIGTTPLTKELTKFARDFMNQNQNATPLTVAAIVYLLITIPLTFLVRRLERSAGKGRAGVGGKTTKVRAMKSSSQATP